MVQRIATRLTGRIYEMPVLVLMPHSRCNCRCVMCDIWKANQNKSEISIAELTRHIEAFKKLGVRRVALSGGEALMHSNIWRFCELLKSIGTKISLLSTGLTLKANAAEIIKHCDDVIVSLDGSRDVHNKIRNIPSAFEKLAEGVAAIKAIKPDFKITGRSVIQRLNYQDFLSLLGAAKELGLDQISFLPADISSTAFNRAVEWPDDHKQEVALTEIETKELESILKNSFDQFRSEYKNKFIAESPEKMIQIVDHYRAHLGLGKFPRRKCNAPWVSAVVESNGDVLPCFFHKPYGNLHEREFSELLNSEKAVQFRKQLNVSQDPICQKCVCSLNYRAPLFER